MDAGDDYFTEPTFFGQEPTDMHEDFFIDEFVIQVPVGSRFLFVSPDDSYFGDNGDIDGNYALQITGNDS